MPLTLSDEQARRLRDAEALWLATVKPSPAAHLVPIWAILLDGALYMATEPRSQKVRNLRAFSRAAVSLPDTRDVLILEGEVATLEGEAPPGVLEAFEKKYDWSFRPGSSWILLRFVPDKVISWTST